jgi:SAM-dependent MidA family methyltransferase
VRNDRQVPKTGGNGLNINGAMGGKDRELAIKNWLKRSTVDYVSFHDYMGFCLYDDQFGYYRSAVPKIGKAGDFYTSSSIGTVMGEMVASWLASVCSKSVNHGQNIHIVEWGGGNGLLALHTLNELEQTFPNIYTSLSWTMIESSAYHRTLQQQALKKHAERGIIHYQHETEWRTEGQPNGTFAVILANELLDAFPVHRVKYDHEQLWTEHVIWDEQQNKPSGMWVALDQAAEGFELLAYMKRNGIKLLKDQICELQLDCERWIEGLSQWMVEGCALIIDYGDLSEELYAAHRMRGTLLAYHKHQALDDPYNHPGEQDLTSHVNFSVCMQSAYKEGFTMVKLMTQKEFLVEQGILFRLQDAFGADPFSETARRNRSIRQLLISDGMSELFKVLLLQKNIDS